jgi:hypothetical protein
MYMHTLEGRPASYEPGYQIHFATQGRYARKGIRLVASIKQIRAEQRASDAYRRAQKFGQTIYAYGYARIEVPS